MKIRFGLCAYFAFAVLSFILLPSAQASISTYSSLVAWQAANPTSTLQDFSSLLASSYYNPYSSPADGTIQTTYSGTGGSGNSGVYTSTSPPFGTGQYLDADTYSYNQSGYNGGYYEYVYYWNGSCYCNYGGVVNSQAGYNYGSSETSSLVLTPPTDTTSLGFEVGQAYNYSILSIRNITATVTTADNQTQSLNVSNAYGGGVSFFGFDASSPITSVVITAAVNPGVYSPYGGGTSYYYGSNCGFFGCTYYEDVYAYNSSYTYTDESQLAFDNLMYATPSSVPEPTSVLLLGSAVLAVGWTMRKNYPHAL